MGASGLAIAVCAASAITRAESPEIRRATPSYTPLQYRESKDRARYLSDLTQIKNATLESESAFFDRLEKQKKIEDVRQDVRSAASDLRSVRSKFSPADLVLLEQADEPLTRVAEPLEEAGAYIAAAELELRRYHEGATAESREIVSGKRDGAALLSRIRRVLKAAEASLQRVATRLPRAQDTLEAARSLVEKALDDPKTTDAQRQLLQECKKSCDAAADSLMRTTAQTADLITLLESTRRDYLPECLPGLASVGSPTRGGSQPESAPAKYSGACDDASLGILNKSTPALTELDHALKQHADTTASYNMARNARQTAVTSLEMAEALVSPAVDKLRRLQTQANELLEKVEDQLLEIKRLLIEDMPGETSECALCGGTVIRTRRVLDPACTCVRSNDAMLEVEDSIRQAQALAGKIGDTLDEMNGRGELAQKLRSTDDGVLFKLTRALQRSEEFRKQQFDVLPGESIPRIAQEMPKRDFPPMTATYVARQTWHYPLYFEDISLERYGLHHGCLQPFVSYGKFIADLVLLPYNMTLEPPCCVQYDFGMYRPGDDAPHLIYLPRPDCKAAIVEALVWTGLFFTP
jgi:hypothetical protein